MSLQFELLRHSYNTICVQVLADYFIILSVEMVAIVVPENYGYVLHCVEVRKTIDNLKLIKMPVPSLPLP